MSLVPDPPMKYENRHTRRNEAPMRPPGNYALLSAALVFIVVGIAVAGIGLCVAIVGGTPLLLLAGLLTLLAGLGIERQLVVACPMESQPRDHP